MLSQLWLERGTVRRDMRWLDGNMMRRGRGRDDEAARREYAEHKAAAHIRQALGVDSSIRIIRITRGTDVCVSLSVIPVYNSTRNSRSSFYSVFWAKNVPIDRYRREVLSARVSGSVIRAHLKSCGNAWTFLKRLLRIPAQGVPNLPISKGESITRSSGTFRPAPAPLGQ